MAFDNAAEPFEIEYDLTANELERGRLQWILAAKRGAVAFVTIIVSLLIAVLYGCVERDHAARLRHLHAGTVNTALEELVIRVLCIPTLLLVFVVAQYFARSVKNPVRVRHNLVLTPAYLEHRWFESVQRVPRFAIIGIRKLPSYVAIEGDRNYLLIPNSALAASAEADTFLDVLNKYRLAAANPAGTQQAPYPPSAEQEGAGFTGGMAIEGPDTTSLTFDITQAAYDSSYTRSNTSFIVISGVFSGTSTQLCKIVEALGLRFPWSLVTMFPTLILVLVAYAFIMRGPRRLRSSSLRYVMTTDLQRIFIANRDGAVNSHLRDILGVLQVNGSDIRITQVTGANVIIPASVFGGPRESEAFYLTLRRAWETARKLGR